MTIDTSRWSLRRFLPLTEIELIALFSEGKSLVSSLLLEPVVQLVLLAAGLQGLIGGGDDFYHGHRYLAFVLPGLIGLQAVRGFSRTMYRTVLDRQWGMLTVKRLAGAGAAGYTLSKVMAPMIALLVQVMALLVLAIAMGVRIPLLNIAMASVFSVVSVGFWAAIAIVITGFVKDYVVRDMVVTWMMLPLSLAAPVFYTLETAPTHLQWIARFNPLAWQVEAMRALLLDGQVTVAVATTIVFAAVAIVAAIFSISWGDALTSEGGR